MKVEFDVPIHCLSEIVLTYNEASEGRIEDFVQTAARVGLDAKCDVKVVGIDFTYEICYSDLMSFLERCKTQ